MHSSQQAGHLEGKLTVAVAALKYDYILLGIIILIIINFHTGHYASIHRA